MPARKGPPVRRVHEDPVQCPSVALPIAAGVFEPSIGLVLRPEIAALSMSGSIFIVTVNALMLKRLRLPVPQDSSATAGAPIETPATLPMCGQQPKNAALRRTSQERRRDGRAAPRSSPGPAIGDSVP